MNGHSTNAELDAWGAGLTEAKKGGDAAVAEYFRRNPMPGSGWITAAATAGAGGMAQAEKAAAAEALATKNGVKFIEREGNVVVASFKGANGEARVIAEMVRNGDTLILRGAHIEGSGTLKEALSAAKTFGRELGFKQVIIEGGARTTGANPGHIPRAITLITGL